MTRLLTGCLAATVIVAAAPAFAQAESGLLLQELELPGPRIGVARLALQCAELQWLAIGGPRGLRQGRRRGADRRGNHANDEETRHGRNAPRKNAGRSS